MKRFHELLPRMLPAIARIVAISAITAGNGTLHADDKPENGASKAAEKSEPALPAPLPGKAEPPVQNPDGSGKPAGPEQANPEKVPGLMEPEPLPPPEAEPPASAPQNRTWRTGTSASPAPSTFIPFSQDKPEDHAPTYSIPGFYGAGPQNLTFGKGRLAKGAQYRFSLGLGANDNPNRTSGNQSQENGNAWSAFTSLDFGYSTQFARFGQVLVFDASASTELYWNGDTDPNYNVDLTLAYQKSFASPASLSANAHLGYHTQSDYSQVNVAPTQGGGGGSVLSASAKLDLGYIWSPQFNTRTSLGVSSVWNLGSSQQSDHWDLTLGNELRFRAGRFTWIAEGRYQILRYVDSGGSNVVSLTGANQDADTAYILAGAEWVLGPWIQTSLRAGASLRNTDSEGGGASPYGEFSANFNPDAQNKFQLVLRYGFEEAVVPGRQTKTFRSGVTYGRVFTSRLSTSLSANYLVSESGQGMPGAGPSGSGSSTALDGSLSVDYRLSSRWSLGARYSITRSESDSGATESYVQNRVMFSAQTSF